MASERSKAIWDQSISLSEFITKEAVRRSSEAPLASERLRWQIPELLFRFAGNLFGQDSVPEEVRDGVRRDRLVVTAYREKSSHSREPVEIPKNQFLHGRFRLLMNAVVIGEFSYRDIRIIERDALSNALLSTRPHQQSRHREISRIICDMNASGAFEGKLRKQQIHMVRAALENAGIKNLGADKTIERLIRKNIPR